MTDAEEDRIRKRAYEIWEAMGRPEGMHEETWQQAQIEIAASDAYGLGAETIRAMQNTVVSNETEARDSASGPNTAPPNLLLLKASVSD